MLTFTIRLAAFRRQGKVPNPTVGVRFRYMCLTGKWDTMDMTKLFGLAGAATLAVGLSASAAFAVPVLENSVNNVPEDGTNFTGAVFTGVGGAGMWEATFNAPDGTPSTATVSLLPEQCVGLHGSDDRMDQQR